MWGKLRQVSEEPRIPLGSRRRIGPLNAAIVWAIGRASGGRPPNVFTTLARHRGLFRRWLFFAGGLMPGGRLPREETELLILRAAHNCDCDYEWRHHERIGRQAGLSAEEVERVREGPDAAGWLGRRAALLRAPDQLHAERTLSDEVWASLRGELRDVEFIELCMLVGHYEMLAMTLNALRVEPDPQTSGAPPRVLALLERRRT